MSQKAAIRRRKQAAHGYKHVARLGRSIRKASNIADREKRAKAKAS